MSLVVRYQAYAALPEEVMIAAQNGDALVIQDWFSSGTRDPNEKSPNLGSSTLSTGETLLFRAASRGRCNVMRVLLAHGADTEVICCIDHLTALEMALLAGEYAAMVLLLDHGARVDSASYGTQPLLVEALEDDDHQFVNAAIRLLLHHGADLDACDFKGYDAYDLANRNTHAAEAVLIRDIRLAGGWKKYVRFPRKKLVSLRILAEQGRADTTDPLLVRLFPAGPPAPEPAVSEAHGNPGAAPVLKRALKAALADQPRVRNLDVDALAAAVTRALAALPRKRPREAYRAQKGGPLPRGIFWHILGYWRSSHDYDREWGN